MVIDIQYKLFKLYQEPMPYQLSCSILFCEGMGIMDIVLHLEQSPRTPQVSFWILVVPHLLCYVSVAGGHLNRLEPWTFLSKSSYTLEIPFHIRCCQQTTPGRTTQCCYQCHWEKKRNKSGPRMDPWGTPATQGIDLEERHLLSHAAFWMSGNILFIMFYLWFQRGRVLQGQFDGRLCQIPLRSLNWLN